MADNEKTYTEQATETAQQACATAEEKFAEYQRMAQQYSDQAATAIKENPVTSVLIGFGLGLGVGVIVSGLISGSAPASTRSRYGMQMAEDLGRHMLDSIGEYIPDAIAKRFQS